jgi:hypothetical protein
MVTVEKIKVRNLRDRKDVTIYLTLNNWLCHCAGAV